MRGYYSEDGVAEEEGPGAAPGGRWQQSRNALPHNALPHKEF
jgi:hypothetical protein